MGERWKRFKKSCKKGIKKVGKAIHDYWFPPWPEPREPDPNDDRFERFGYSGRPAGLFDNIPLSRMEEIRDLLMPTPIKRPSARTTVTVDELIQGQEAASGNELEPGKSLRSEVHCRGCVPNAVINYILDLNNQVRMDAMGWPLTPILWDPEIFILATRIAIAVADYHAGKTMPHQIPHLARNEEMYHWIGDDNDVSLADAVAAWLRENREGEGPSLHARLGEPEGRKENNIHPSFRWPLPLLDWETEAVGISHVVANGRHYVIAIYRLNKEKLGPAPLSSDDSFSESTITLKDALAEGPPAAQEN